MTALEEHPSSVDNLASLHDVSESIQKQTVDGVAAIIERGDDQFAAPERTENLSKIQRLAYLVSRLTYQDYLIVEDFTSKIRSGASPSELALERGVYRDIAFDRAIVVQDANTVSGDVREIINLLLDLQKTEEFQDDAALFVRAAYPFGKNIINREFKKNQPSAIAVKEGVKAEFTLNNTTVTIEVHEGDSCSVNCEGSSKPLRDGDALVIGRTFTRSSFFDQSVADISSGQSGKIEIQPQLPVTKDLYVSRAGMMIVRKDGFIYAFDRGSKNQFSFDVSRNDEQSISGRYDPSAIGGDGMRGRSIIDFVLPDEDLRRLELDSASDESI